MAKKTILTLLITFLFVQIGMAKINPFQQEYNRDSIQDKWVDSVLNELNLEEKIAQLLMVRAYSNKDDDHKKYINTLIKKYKIGGLCFFQGGPVRQAELTNYYQSNSKVPLLISIDAEWGLGMRLDSTISYPRQMMLGAIQDNRLIYDMGADIADQLKQIGVHVNFAPVIDINNNAKNPVINSRSFGELRYNVSEKGMAYMLGLQDNFVLATAKHFPGHGDTDTDSHYALPIIKHSYERLDSLELFPFRELVQNGLGGVMVAHLSIPALESDPNIASTISHNIVTNILKNDLGFQGLIITDALDMKGVSNYHKSGELELMAFKAGNDILLLPQDVPKAINSIKRAVRNGEISRLEIDKRCKKILATKFWVGLDKNETIKTKNLYHKLNQSKYISLKHELVENAITLLKNEDEILPIKNMETLNIATVVIGDTSLNAFQETVELYTTATHFNIGRNASSEEFNSLMNKLEAYNLILVANTNTDQRPSKNFGIKPNAVDFVNKLSERKNVVFDLFSNPYALANYRDLKEAKAIIMSYEDNDLSYEKSVQAIFGGVPFRGKLPISTVNFNAGEGIDTEIKTRLSYGLPESEEMNSEILSKIDTIVKRALLEKASPGCQVLVARNGNVVYNKAFGYHTYMKKQEVETTDIYDLASITKIAATLPLLMQLEEQNIISLDSTLGTYLPELKSTNKEDLKLIDILTHKSKLLSWINFYISTFESLDADKEMFNNELTEDYPFHLGNHTYLFRDYKFMDNLYTFSQSEEYPNQVADGMFMQTSFRDTIYNRITRSELRETEGYKYSDLGYYYFYKFLEDYYNEQLETISENKLYHKIGATTMGFYPLKRFPKDQIIPTQNDVIFRKQLIHGHVHDPGAAMLGGVCGHAGLFSNANDLAKIMQMYLNKGIYGSQQFLKEETIDLFNTCHFCEEDNRRGIGFDKPEPNPDKEGPTSKNASPKSFGHTGFTGTIAWADPEYNLIYIFLSNRIHPDQNNSNLVKMNVRTDIQDIIYQSIE